MKVDYITCQFDTCLTFSTHSHLPHLVVTNKTYLLLKQKLSIGTQSKIIISLGIYETPAADSKPDIGINRKMSHSLRTMGISRMHTWANRKPCNIWKENTVAVKSPSVIYSWIQRRWLQYSSFNSKAWGQKNLSTINPMHDALKYLKKNYYNDKQNSNRHRTAIIEWNPTADHWCQQQ